MRAAGHRRSERFVRNYIPAAREQLAGSMRDSAAVRKGIKKHQQRIVSVSIRQDERDF
jgi:hypothetical protein